MGNLGQYTDGGINPDEHEASKEFEPLPAAWYPVEIEKAEVKETSKGTGTMLKIQFSVIGEAYNNRKLFSQLNIQNPSTVAQEIGRRQLADIARACGIAFLDDEDNLLAKTLEVHVVVKPRSDTKELDNEIKGYRALGGATKTAPAATSTTATAPGATKPTPPAQNPAAKPAAAAPGGKMPWER